MFSIYALVYAFIATIQNAFAFLMRPRAPVPDTIPMAYSQPQPSISGRVYVDSLDNCPFIFCKITTPHWVEWPARNYEQPSGSITLNIGRPTAEIAAAIPRISLRNYHVVMSELKKTIRAKEDFFIKHYGFVRLEYVSTYHGRWAHFAGFGMDGKIRVKRINIVTPVEWMIEFYA